MLFWTPIWCKITNPNARSLKCTQVKKSKLRKGLNGVLKSHFFFAFPGNLNTFTGGYHYNRRLIAELKKLGIDINTLSLSERFPFPNDDALEHARKSIALIPDGSVVIIDGLAFGAMERISEAEKDRLFLIALVHHPLALETGLTESQRKFLTSSETQALRFTRAVIVTSQNTCKVLVKDYSVPKSKITVALPGTKKYPFAKCQGKPVKLLTVATLTKRKGHDVLIDALKNLKNLQWEARFIGEKNLDPVWANLVEKKVRSTRLSDRITITGAVSDLFVEYQSADIFVLPSRFEGYGMVLAEAIANGLPIIASNAGAIPDVAPKSASILIPPDDSAALAKALGKVITDSDLRKKMQLNACRAAKDLPSWSQCAELVMQCIKAVY